MEPVTKERILSLVRTAYEESGGVWPAADVRTFRSDELLSEMLVDAVDRAVRVGGDADALHDLAWEVKAISEQMEAVFEEVYAA